MTTVQNKKIVAIISLLLAMSLSLAGCANDVSLNVSFDEIYFKSLNYNNYYNYHPSCVLWTSGDTYLYNIQTHVDVYPFIYQNGGKASLFEPNDFTNEAYYGYFFPINDFAYFTTSDYDDNQNFYRFSFADQSYEKIFTAHNTHSWMGTPDYIAFTQRRNEDEARPSDLFVYSIEKGATAPLCNDISHFSIVNGKIRYLTSASTDTLALFEYDYTNGEAKKIGEIPVEISANFPVVNFTSDYTIIAQYVRGDYRKITVHSSDGLTFEYSLPKPIQQFVAGENFAYAVCYEHPKNSSTALKHKDNGIYKINLKDGSYEVIEAVVNDGTNIHVVSDDEICITQFESNFIGQYKRCVYKIFAGDKTKSKLVIN